MPQRTQVSWAGVWMYFFFFVRNSLMVASCSSVMGDLLAGGFLLSLVGRFSPLQDEQLLQGVSWALGMENHFSNWTGMQARVVAMRWTSFRRSSSWVSWSWWYE